MTPTPAPILPSWIDGVFCASHLHMSLAEIIRALKDTAPALRARGVEHLAIFGSRARENAGPHSDIDVLLDVPRDVKFSLVDLVGVERLIGQAVGCPAGAILRDGATPEFIEKTRPDVVEVF